MPTDFIIEKINSVCTCSNLEKNTLSVPHSGQDNILTILRFCISYATKSDMQCNLMTSNNVIMTYQADLRLTVWPDVYREVLSDDERCDVQCIRIFLNSIEIEDVSKIQTEDLGIETRIWLLKMFCPSLPLHVEREPHG